MSDHQKRASSSRGVSPVIGVVLMVAVTITLFVAVAPIVLGMTGDVDTSEPQASFAFSYDETIDASVKDSFGTTGTSADGLLKITLEDGSMDAERLEVLGATSEGKFDDSDAFATDSEVSAGDSITVWATRGQTVRVIHTVPEEDQTFVVDEFTVVNSDAVSPYTPWPPVDHDCDWVDSQVGAGGDLTIDGVVVKCDLSDYPVQNLDMVNGGVLVGAADITGTLSMNSGGGEIYEGDVDAQDTYVKDGSEVNGDINAGGNLDVDGDSTVNGNINADGDVSADKSVINGDIVTQTGSNGDVNIDSTGGDATTVNGKVVSDGNVDLESDTEVTETITSDGTVSLGTNAVVGSHVTADSVSCSSGATINGEPCSDYVAPHFAVTIDSTNDPVEEGDTLDVTATIENTGINDGTQTMALDIDGFQNDTSSLTVAGGNQQTVTLSWATSSGDKGTYTATVSSDDDSESTSVEVSDQSLASLSISSFSIADTDENDAFTVPVEVQESDGTGTNNFEVNLVVEDPDGNVVYDATGTNGEISGGGTQTFTFGSDDGTPTVGSFDPGTGFTATATATADNAPDETAADTFEITADSYAAKTSKDDGSASGGTVPSFDFDTTEPIEVDSLSLETKATFSTTNSGKDRFEVGSKKTQKADDTSGTFIYNFNNPRTFDGLTTVKFDSMASSTNSLTLVNDESNADLVVGVLMTDGSEKYFYLDES